ncbi:hypothetical protein QQP08_016182 [Theobroma cacao]|nr:hypothetical protein QQP08_016182 [Theobroma cacao]
MNNFSHLNINQRRTRVCNRRECILIRQNIHFSHLGVKPKCFREQPIVEKRTEFSSPRVIIIEWILCSCLEFDTDDNAFLGLGFPPKEVLFFLLPCSFLLVSYHVKGVIKIGTVNYPIDIFSLQNPSNGSNVAADCPEAVPPSINWLPRQAANHLIYIPLKEELSNSTCCSCIVNGFVWWDNIKQRIFLNLSSKNYE